MTHEQRLELLASVKELIPIITHTIWPSGICADGCGGCRVERRVRSLIDRLMTDVAADSPTPLAPTPASPGTGPAPKPTSIRDMRARVRPQKTKTAVP